MHPSYDLVSSKSNSREVEVEIRFKEFFPSSLAHGEINNKLAESRMNEEPLKFSSFCWSVQIFIIIPLILQCSIPAHSVIIPTYLIVCLLSYQTVSDWNVSLFLCE